QSLSSPTSCISRYDQSARMSTGPTPKTTRHCAAYHTQSHTTATTARFCRLAYRGNGYALTFSRHRLDRGIVALRGDRKSSFDNVDAQRLQLPRQFELLGQVHRAAGRLLAVAQSGIENLDSLDLLHPASSLSDN